MRTFLLFLLSTMLVVAEESPSDFMKSWVAAFDKNDAEALLSYYDRSEETECLVSAGLWFKGFQEIKAMYEQDMGAVRFSRSRAEGMKHRLLGEAAVVSFVHKFQYEVPETGEHYRIHIRTTATLKKDEDGWKIVSEHSSPIEGIARAEIIPEE